MSLEIDAGSVRPSTKQYIVTYTHGHKTLSKDDIVIMLTTPVRGENYLLRLKDFTRHQLEGPSEQYVHLKEYALP